MDIETALTFRGGTTVEGTTWVVRALADEVVRLRAVEAAARTYCTAPAHTADPDAPDVEGLYYDLRKALGLPGGA